MCIPSTPDLKDVRGAQEEHGALPLAHRGTRAQSGRAVARVRMMGQTRIMDTMAMLVPKPDLQLI
jgi:hypothetical protein